MSKGRTVYRNDAGQWSNKRNDASKAGSVHTTQKGAIDQARDSLKKEGGGELTIKGEGGRIRSKDTIAPGHESPTRDKEH